MEWGGARAGAMVGLSSEGGELTINRFGGGVRLWDEGRVFPGVLGVGSPAEEVRGNLEEEEMGCLALRCLLLVGGYSVEGGGLGFLSRPRIDLGEGRAVSVGGGCDRPTLIR